MPVLLVFAVLCTAVDQVDVSVTACLRVLVKRAPVVPHGYDRACTQGRLQPAAASGLTG
jgi:hypothetical protein